MRKKRAGDRQSVSDMWGDEPTRNCNYMRALVPMTLRSWASGLHSHLNETKLKCTQSGAGSQSWSWLFLWPDPHGAIFSLVYSSISEGWKEVIS